MNKVRIRETLYMSHSLEELSFNIREAESHFMNILQDGTFPPTDYSQYRDIEINVVSGPYGASYTIEGSREETDEELEGRRTITEDKDYQKFLELQKKYGHLTQHKK